jgi:hypothetical protein
LAAASRAGATLFFCAETPAPSTASVGAGVSTRLGAGERLRRAARMAKTTTAENAETASMTRAVLVGGPSAAFRFDRASGAFAAAFVDVFFDALDAFFAVSERGTGTSSSSSSSAIILGGEKRVQLFVGQIVEVVHLGGVARFASARGRHGRVGWTLGREAAYSANMMSASTRCAGVTCGVRRSRVR